MNKQNVSSLPDENKIEELLTKIQPVPSDYFHKKMEQAHWRTEPFQLKGIANKTRLKLAGALVLLLAIITFAVTPQGRAWAQEAARFFTRINSATVQLSDEQMKWMTEPSKQQYDLPLVPVFVPAVSPEMAAIAGCETPQKSQSYRCQVALAESKLGFDLKELPESPNGWEFKSLYINTNSQYAVMNFDLDFKYFGINSNGFMSYSSLMFIQGLGDFSNFDWYKGNPWEAAPADKIEPVSIGAYIGEYAKGRFGLSSDNELIWSDADRRQRLIWSEGARWYLIDFQPNLNITGTMGKEQLIHLAEILVNSSTETNKPLNPDRLVSISDAEKISGLDLKAPTLLPMEMDFSYARYLPNEQQVQLIYGLNESLVIDEWIGDPIAYKKPLGKYEFNCEIVSMDGTDGFYCFYDGSNPRAFLWWHKDNLNYQMSYDSFSLGGKLDREKMLLIAESMQDIDDFLKKSGRNYEQIVLYEQALKIDAKKFQVTPAGWTFANFWGDLYSQCIGLTYTSVTGKSTLFINECKTDKNSDTSIFPFRSIKQVKVGNAKGKYIAGSFVITDDGKQVWDPTSPRRQLYWQADGLWMQVIVYGDEALLSGKDDLISFAESLK